MRRCSILLLALVCPFLSAQPAGKLSYPQARKSDQVDDYHGVKILDPYRSLEDANSPETRQWIQAENNLTSQYLGRIPAREAIRKRLTELWNYERFSVPHEEGGRYFFTRNSGLQNQSVLYVADSLDAEPRILLDPNTLSKDGTVALQSTAISRDGRQLAYGLSAAGSDWVEWRIRDVQTANDRPDHIRWTKWSGAAWTLDHKGFFYTRLPEPPPGQELQAANYNQQLCYHRVGTPQTDDAVIYRRPDHKEWGFDGHVTEDGRYLILSIRVGTERKNRLFFKDLGDRANPALNGDSIVELLNDFDAQYTFLGNDGPVFWFLTDQSAPRNRIIAIDTRSPARANWKELVPQTADTLQSAEVVGERFILRYLHDAKSLVKIHHLDGRFDRDIELPGIGSAAGFSGKRTDTETFYSFTSFTVPGAIYRYDMKTGRSAIFRKPAVAFDPDQYESKQFFYTSKDGTRVPMFLTHKKGMKLDGNNPTLLYGYGGFRISLTPTFSVSNLVWMEMGGVYAVPNLRGGGEYGQEWHDAGKVLKKQNVFDDFIAAAQWLIENKYTSTPRLAIAGGSNGGLLVGACMTQRPDLFGACLPAVGVMDMLRFNKFTIGWAWESDFGSPQNPDHFKALRSYSPLHNLKPGVHYPATLITTSDHDDRVVPAHSFKFAAALQAAQSGSAPCLIRIETKAGHGAGKPTTKIIEELADRYAFLVANLKMTLP